MAKVFRIYTVELRPGVNGEEFEKFILEEYAPLGRKIGWNAILIKGERGERAGKYGVIWEIDSLEALNRISPSEGEISEEGMRLLGPEFLVLNEKYDTLAAQLIVTDYIELGK